MFCRFCDEHGFEKPNDERGLFLMDKAAQVYLHNIHLCMTVIFYSCKSRGYSKG